MENISAGDKILYIWDGEAPADLVETVTKLTEASKEQVKVENFSRLDFAQYPNSSFDKIISIVPVYTLDFFSKLLKLLKQQGTIGIPKTSALNDDEIFKELKLSGFVGVKVESAYITGEKPKYEVGASVKLSFAIQPKETSKKTAAVWKLSGDDEDEEEIDPDDLLDEDDKIKPDPASLKVCGTTGKRKACKDCSCGLAAELAAENGGGKTQSSEQPKSSCGSCYLGDAFRCASCPYLGMPAFKPGEKVQLNANLLQADT